MWVGCCFVPLLLERSVQQRAVITMTDTAIDTTGSRATEHPQRTLNLLIPRLPCPATNRRRTVRDNQ